MNYKHMNLGGQNIFVPIWCFHKVYELFIHVYMFVYLYKRKYCVSVNISTFFLLDQMSVFHKSEDLMKMTHTNIFSF